MEKITESAVVFGIGFLCFIYANVARFKRFKGLGFEAELWEDKQKEAADLIERLSNVVTIYTRETVLGKVKSGRWDSGGTWGDRWKLYNELVLQHEKLGQKIDFSKLKTEMDDYFLFDMTMPGIQLLSESANRGSVAAMQKIQDEFGSPIQDSDGYCKRSSQHHSATFEIDEPFEISKTKNLAGYALELWSESKLKLKRDFDVDIEIEPKAKERLETISKLYQKRPAHVTDELVSWANHHEWKFST